MTQNTKNLVIILAVAAAFVFGGLILLAGGKTPTAAPATTGTAPVSAPDFELELYSGKTVRLSDFKGKKPVIVNFWASWCGPCRAEAPVLARLGKTYGDDIEFLGVVVNDRQDKAEAFIKEFDVPYENGPDKASIAGSYKITGIPETFWIDKEGQIVDHWIGAIDEGNMTSRTENLIAR